MQPFDLTTLVAICHELNESCLPARLEQVYQSDRHTIYLALRTLEKRIWLLISWHPQIARIHLSSPPPPDPDTFTFSQQIWHQVTGLALVAIALVSPWERVLDLQFAKRPDDPIQAHLFVEIMGKYSNVILVNSDRQIVTAAHQVSSKQSRVRPIQTSDRYELPPALLENIPDLSESLELWRDRLSLIPQPILKSLVTNYRGVSSALGRSILNLAAIDPNISNADLTSQNWQNLDRAWRRWLQCLEGKQFFPEKTSDGYTLISNPVSNSATNSDSQNPNRSVNDLVRGYYGQISAKQEFQQLSDRIHQTLQTHLKKLSIKSQSFQDRLEQSNQAELIKTSADLLMAHITDWESGWEQGDKMIILKDFNTQMPITIPLDPQQNIVQNAQALYKKYQKQKRAKEAIAPLLAAVNQEIQYLQQVQTAASHLRSGESGDVNESEDLTSLKEIQQELEQQEYLKSHTKATPKNAQKTAQKSKSQKSKLETAINCHRFKSPSGFEIWVGRNNFQNDRLTFKVATDYDLWLHTQEIPGSHVLLRLDPGSVADQLDLQKAADLAAYYSQARQSDRVPVVFTKPKNVFKPKGAKPGMVVYRQEQVIWGQPTQIAPVL